MSRIAIDPRTPRRLAALAVAALAACSGETTAPSSSAPPPAPPPSPTLSGVTPAAGTVGTELIVTGTDFRSGMEVFVGDAQASAVELSGDTAAFAMVPVGIPSDTALAVRVRNGDGTEASLSDAFTAIAPVLAFVNGATKPSGNVGSTAIIEGDAFGDMQGDGEVLFSDGAGGTLSAAIASPDDWTNTFIVTTVPQGAEDGPIVVRTATGTSDELPFTVTDAATFSPSTIEWTVTSDLPTAMSGHQAVFVSVEDGLGATAQYTHVLGGRDNSGDALDAVAFGRINADGTIDGWSGTAPLPAPRAFHAAVAATPFNSKAPGAGRLIVLGGVDAAGAPSSAVFIGTLADDGSVSSWSEGPPLPEPLHSLGAVLFRSAIYVAGGAGEGNVPVAAVYRARLDSLGQLGAWEPLPALPSPRAYHGFVGFGGFLYSVGGESAAVTPEDGDFGNNDTKLDEVAFARIDLRTGDLSDAGWIINENTLQKRRSKHSTLVAGGNLFVSSGLYAAAGTGSSENTFAQIFADGTVDSFNGATGSNTLLSEGGANLFNQAAVAYVDADGVAHVMILGGDDVNDPGTPRATVLFY